MPKGILLTLIALTAFAGNSILCRMALKAEAIDPVSFTGLRLLSGALVLAPLLRRRPRPWNARGAATLLSYAFAFSLAYVWLDAGTGALLLFGAVQATMIGAGLHQGERLGPTRILGVTTALAGLVLLVLPGVSAPEPKGTVLMLASGVAWGAYSLIGRGQRSPSASTACNFVLAAPVGLIALALHAPWMTMTASGASLAIASGALTSGLGYVIWYAALPRHSATSAAVVQLAVPVLAAIAGTLLLNESMTPRSLGAGGLTLAGVALALKAR